MPFFVINAIFVIIVINVFVTKKIQNIVCMRQGQKPILTPYTLNAETANMISEVSYLINIFLRLLCKHLVRKSCNT